MITWKWYKKFTKKPFNLKAYCFLRCFYLEGFAFNLMVSNLAVLPNINLRQSSWLVRIKLKSLNWPITSYRFKNGLQFWSLVKFGMWPVHSWLLDEDQQNPLQTQKNNKFRQKCQAIIDMCEKWLPHPVQNNWIKKK